MPSRPELPDHILPDAQGGIHFTQAGQGPAIVLIHGSLCDYRYWRWQIPALSRQFRIIAPSLRGCWPNTGQHPQPGYRLARHAADIQRLIRACTGHEGAHVVGHSRGAQVAVLLAEQAPELCRSLTLADPGFRFSDEPETRPFYADLVNQLDDAHQDASLQTFVDTVNGADSWRRMVGWFKAMVRDNASTLRSQVQEANDAIVASDVAARIHCPVLLMGGAKSPSRYVSRLDRLQAILPACRRVQISAAAHGMNLANPLAFNRALQDFVQSVEDPDQAPDPNTASVGGPEHHQQRKPQE